MCFLGKYNEHMDCVILLNMTKFRIKNGRNKCLKNKMRRVSLYFRMCSIIRFIKAISVIKRLQNSASDHMAMGTDTKYFARIYTGILFCKTPNPIVIYR
jgi:hypothetical protein